MKTFFFKGTEFQKWSIYLQQAVNSSARSSQSCFPSHSCVLLIHFGLPPGEPLGHKNFESGHSTCGQFSSSDPSPQSL